MKYKSFSEGIMEKLSSVPSFPIEDQQLKYFLHAGIVPVGDPGQGLSGQAQRSGVLGQGTVMSHPGGTTDLWP